MKKVIAILMVALLTASLAGCIGKQTTQDEDICPGKQLGNEGVPTTMAEGFDPTEDMSFSAVDTNGAPVTNDIFAGTDKGVWLVFWQTDNKKSETELKRLDTMLSTAEENGYKIVGIVMDGEKNTDKAKEMTLSLDFTNIIWNNEVAKRFEGVAQFFSKKYYDENLPTYQQFELVPGFGDPVSTYANSRGQIQSSCFLLPPSNEKMKGLWETINANASFEELQEQDKEPLGREGDYHV